MVDMLMSGFDLNSVETRHIGEFYCLIAIEQCHFNVAKSFIRRGVKLDSVGLNALIWEDTPPPLDLFDMLLPLHIINDLSEFQPMPLHEAACFGRNKIIWHLIKLGANVDQCDIDSHLPIECFMKGPSAFSDIELFKALLPSKPLGVDNIKLIVSTLYKPDRGYKTGMLQQVLQRLIIDEPLEVEIVPSHPHNFMTVNKVPIFHWVGSDFAPLCGCTLSKQLDSGFATTRFCFHTK